MDTMPTAEDEAAERVPETADDAAYDEPVDAGAEPRPDPWPDASATDEPADEPAEPAGPPPDWWHRDHPTFVALTGFFTGLVTVSVVPGLFVVLMRNLFSDRVAEETFPFVLLFGLVPVGLLVFPQTRRFGRYLLLGMVVTLLVVFGVGTAVFWFMLRTQT